MHIVIGQVYGPPNALLSTIAKGEIFSLSPENI